MKRIKYNLGDLISEFSSKAKNFVNFKDLEFYGVSNEQGIIPSKYASIDKIENYKIIEQGCFAYNPYRINVGSIAFAEHNISGLISPAYVIFKANENLIIPYLLFKFLKSSEGLRQISFNSRGSVREALRYDDLCKLEINLPNLDDQMRLFTKIQKCESIYNKLKHEIDQQLSLLTSLRQAILSEAVQGQLTAQWRKENPNQEHARELLKRIAAEKAQLLKEKKINKEKPLPVIKEDEVSYELPEGWVWCRLGELILSIEAGKSPVCEPRPANLEEWGVVKISAVTWDKFIESENKLLPKHIEPFKDKEIRGGDFIMTRANTLELIAKAVVAPKNVRAKLLLSDKTLRVDFSELIDKFYIINFNNGPLARKHYSSVSSGTSDSMKNISRENILSLTLPLPNVLEQRAIVQIVNTLMSYCDALEEQAQQSKVDLDLLMQSMLSEVFGTENQASGIKPIKIEPLENETLIHAEVIQKMYQGNALNMELLEILQKQGGKIAAVNLWKMSKYQKDIDAFYEALKKEVEQNKTIKESSEKGWLELVAS
jgi:type I restriction enzyme S subunit